MIQVSFSLSVPEPPAPPAPPLRLTFAAGTARVTGHWPHRELAPARRQLAAFFATLAPEVVARCNLTGRARPVGAWLPELIAPPSVATVLHARHTIVQDPDGGPTRLVARLFGLYQLGESDLVLIADGRSDVAEAYRFLTSWGAYRLAEAAEPRWDRPFPWGYWLVSFAASDVADAAFWALLRERLDTAHLRDAFDERMTAPPPRVLIEAADPGDADTDYVIGLTQALAAGRAQQLTSARLGAEPAPSPSAQDAAGFCDRVADRFGEAPFFAYREPSQGPLDSGWRFACLDPDHRHDASSLRIAPLGRAGAAVPGLVAYLALPPGWVVTREDDAFWVNAPGDEQSRLDPPPSEASEGESY